MTEDPKTFLLNVKSGIAEPEIVDGKERVYFIDEAGLSCILRTIDGNLFILPQGGRIVLTPGMVARLINSLERWTLAGNFGNTEIVKE